MSDRWDFVIVGSGFGGSVSALRLTEKGYRVLVIEKGKRFTKDDFAKTNWDLKRWMWRPELGLHGIYQMSFLRHVTIVHGVGVGGGSLTYANTLPMPTPAFFQAPSWSHLAEWQRELAPHYATARRMLGATRYRGETAGDRIIRDIARDLGREEHFDAPDVAVFFGEPGREVDDPYFGGEGPRRTGCTECGACMTGCRVGAKNTLDRNYLYLAEKRGAVVKPETEVTAVRPLGDGGYVLETRSSIARGGVARIEADQVIFSGGVMGTVPLLLAMREDTAGLPGLSARVGDFVRTNSEALLGVVAPDHAEDFSRGIAITSILHTDEHSHLEPVRYGAGSGFIRTMAVPHAEGKTALGRIVRTVGHLARRPLRWARALTTPDYSRHSQILLFMRTLESTLALRLGKSAMTGFRRGLISQLSPGSAPPTGAIPAAVDLARRFADKVGGVVETMFTETLLGTPTTAHILGGACMGASAETGVIDSQHRVFGYRGLYVIDGSAVSANPGVNPSLTITALAERAMSFIPPRASA